MFSVKLLYWRGRFLFLEVPSLVCTEGPASLRYRWVIVIGGSHDACNNGRNKYFSKEKKQVELEQEDQEDKS